MGFAEEDQAGAQEVMELYGVHIVSRSELSSPRLLERIIVFRINIATQQEEDFFHICLACGSQRAFCIAQRKATVFYLYAQHGAAGLVSAIEIGDVTGGGVRAVDSARMHSLEQAKNLANGVEERYANRLKSTPTGPLLQQPIQGQFGIVERKSIRQGVLHVHRPQSVTDGDEHPIKHGFASIRRGLDSVEYLTKFFEVGSVSLMLSGGFGDVGDAKRIIDVRVARAAQHVMVPTIEWHDDPRAERSGIEAAGELTAFLNRATVASGIFELRQKLRRQDVSVRFGRRVHAIGNELRKFAIIV